MLERGYVVAAADDPGLGTPGPHPHLVGISEARAVVDSVRVARMMPNAGRDPRFIVWDHPQGGQAALFIGTIGKTYVPELSLIGVAAAAPATERTTLINDNIGSAGGKNIAAMTLWSTPRPAGSRGRARRLRPRPQGVAATRVRPELSRPRKSVFVWPRKPQRRVQSLLSSYRAPGPEPRTRRSRRSPSPIPGSSSPW